MVLNWTLQHRLKTKRPTTCNELQHPREQYTPKIVFGRPQTGVEKEYLREKTQTTQVPTKYR